MKLLLDQNISYRLVKSIGAHFPGSEQVVRLGLQNASDRDIWAYAKKENFAIVTFDSDFQDLSVIAGHPPKVIVIRSGNLTTPKIFDMLVKRKPEILAFFQDPGASCLELSAE